MEGSNQKWLIALGTAVIISLVVSLVVLVLVLIQNNSLREEVTEIEKKQNDLKKVSNELSKLTNPASVYCEKQGGVSEIITVPDGSQSGVCKFEDGSECEEWAYFRGECPVKEGVISIDNLNYVGSNFELNYPKYLNVEVSTVGVRTTVTFTGIKSTGIKPENQIESLISVSTMPNQSGSTLLEYSQQFVNQNSYIKSSEITIGGVIAHELILPESGAGPRYLFISNDGRTIYDLIIQSFDSDDHQAILTSFILK
jgi:putative hemolysin